MRQRIPGGLVALVLGLALAIAGCSRGGGTVTIDGRSANDHGSKDITGASSVEIEADNDGSDYYFSPTVIAAKPGQEVTVELKNDGNVDHNFTIDSLRINQDLAPGGTARVQVTLPQTGDVTFYCEYHEGSGMLGRFSVS